MTGFRHPVEWSGTSSDPVDEQFGHVVRNATVDEADAFEAVLVGEPTDVAVIGRRGAADGPTAIREAMMGAKTHHFDAGPVGSVADLGDVTGLGDDPAAVQETVESAAAAVHDVDVLPVFLGGDNSLTYPNVAPLLERGSVGVVNLDAHLDCREVHDEPTSGTPYRQLLEAGLDEVCVLGARHFETSTAYHDYFHENDGAVVTAEEVGVSVVDAANAALRSLGDVDALYVSVDCDVLDAAAAPGVSAPTPGGLSTRELFRLVRLLCSDERLAGVEFVECAPSLDRDGLTVTAASRAVAHALMSYRGEHR